jgi:hypothetical protein
MRTLKNIIFDCYISMDNRYFFLKIIHVILYFFNIISSTKLELLIIA